MNGKADADIDWYAIEVECRVSPATLRSIAAKHGVVYANLRRRSFLHGWRRKVSKPAVEADSLPSGDVPPARNRPESPQSDATNAGEPEVAGRMNEACIPLQRALVAYVSTRHDPGSEAFHTERAILEGAALQLEMIRQHRGDVRTARELALTLLGQLQEVTACRDSIEAAIHDFEDNVARRNAMMRAVALPSHIVAMRDLSTTLRQLIPLERQALGIADHTPFEPSGPLDPTERVGGRPELAELEAAIDRTLSRNAPTAQRVG